MKMAAKKPGHDLPGHKYVLVVSVISPLFLGTGKPPTRFLRPVPKHSSTAKVAAEERLKLDSHNADLLLE